MRVTCQRRYSYAQKEKGNEIKRQQISENSMRHRKLVPSDGLVLHEIIFQIIHQ